jgi:hypothetical protein
MIDIKKEYRTRDGQPVKLYTTEHSDESYPVVGCSGGVITMWTKEGRYISPNQLSSLDLVEDILELDWAVDKPIWVRDSETDEWLPRYFSHYDPERKHVYAFIDGKASHTEEEVSYWKYWTDKQP